MSRGENLIGYLSWLHHKAMNSQPSDPEAITTYVRTSLGNIQKGKRERKISGACGNVLEWKLYQLLDAKDKNIANTRPKLPQQSSRGWTSTLASAPREEILRKLSTPLIAGVGQGTIFDCPDAPRYPDSILNIHKPKPPSHLPTSSSIANFPLRPPQHKRAIQRKFTPEPKPTQSDSTLGFTTAKRMCLNANPHSKSLRNIEDNRNLHPTLRNSFSALRKTESAEQASCPKPRFPNFNPPIKGASKPQQAESPQDLKSGIMEHCKTENIEPAMVEIMMNEILDHNPSVSWDDIAGLEFAKSTIKEIVVWPMLRPDLFTGLRGPPKGILLFGPPGTGKTLIGKCIASQAKATFFCVSASSLTSKYVGDGEKLVRALFSVAKFCQPSVVFIDEVDSLLSRRSDSEHESSRRLKTEFLVQLDGATTTGEERLLIVGATNRPQDLDEAARRRLVKRIYIPLPDQSARRQIVCRLLASCAYNLTEEDLDLVCEKTEGYSGADMKHLCKEAAMGPIRDLSSLDITSVTSDQVRPIQLSDFQVAMKRVRASVGPEDLGGYQEWNATFGSEL